MAYKFQLGAFTASGSIKAEEGFDANDQNLVNVGEIEADVLQADNTTLTLKGGSGNATQLILDGSIVEAKTAFRMSGSQLLQFAGTDESIGMASDFSSLDIKSVADIKLSGSTVQVENHNGVDAGLQLGATLVTATGAELNILDGVTATTAEINKLDGLTATTTHLNYVDGAAPGVVTNNVVVVYDGSGRVKGNSFLIGNTVVINSSGDVDANSLSVGNVAITSTPAELNALDGFADDAYTAADSVAFVDAGTGQIRHERNDDFLNTISAQGLEVDSNQLRVKISGSSLTRDADGLKLSDTIPGARTFSDNVTIEGNLIVTGTTVEVDAAFVVTSSIHFEGTTPDDYEVILTSADAQGSDKTITLPDLSGHVPLIAGAIGNANVTAAEFLLLDGGSSIGTTTVAGGHGILMNHGGTMAQTSVDTLAQYVGNNFTETVQTITATTATIDMANGAQVLTNPSANQTLTLPSPSDLEGKILKIKLINDGYKVNISANGSENIDGQSGDIVLESGFAAVSVISDGSNYFII